MCQFVRLGVNASFVVGLDREDISEAVQDCLLAPAGQGVCVSPGPHTCPIDMRKADMAYVSQTAKLYVALLDAYRMEYRSILVCEDDAEVRWDLLPSLNGALQRLGAAEGGFRILFAGAYKALAHAKGASMAHAVSIGRHADGRYRHRDHAAGHSPPPALAADCDLNRPHAFGCADAERQPDGHVGAQADAIRTL